MEVRRLTGSRYDELKGYLPIQVKQDLYALHVAGKNTNWRQYQDLDRAKMKRVDRANLLNARQVPSLANFADEFIFVSGGQDPKWESFLSSVHKYDIQNDSWSRAPALSKPRVGHASCTLNDMIYVFCGGVVNPDDNDDIGEPNPDNSIEFLNARALINGTAQVTWQLVQLAEPNSSPLSARFLPVVAPLNSTEIVILGGDSSIEGANLLLGDMLIFDIESGTIRNIPINNDSSENNSELKFQSSSNISVSTKVDEIAALVMDSHGKLHLLSYTKGCDKVQIVERLV